MLSLDPQQLTLVATETDDGTLSMLVFETEDGERIRFEGEMTLVDRFE